MNDEDKRGETYAVPLTLLTTLLTTGAALPETDDTDDKRDAVDKMATDDVGMVEPLGRDELADSVVCAWAVARRRMRAPRRTLLRVNGCEVVGDMAGIDSTAGVWE